MHLKYPDLVYSIFKVHLRRKIIPLISPDIFWRFVRVILKYFLEFPLIRRFAHRTFVLFGGFVKEKGVKNRTAEIFLISYN